MESEKGKEGADKDGNGKAERKIVILAQPRKGKTRNAVPPGIAS